MNETKPTFKQLTDYFKRIGADTIEHTDKGYLAHAIGVYNDMKKWGESEELCHAAMYHSIYGTEFFQNFTLPVERRGEVQELIGERAERLAYYNCAMDRASFDAAAMQDEPPYRFIDRLTKEEVELSPEDFEDLCRIHLCDWVEQVPRSKQYEYRRAGYRRLADRLGGIAKESYERVYAMESTPAT